MTLTGNQQLETMSDEDPVIATPNNDSMNSKEDESFISANDDESESNTEDNERYEGIIEDIRRSNRATKGIAPKRLVEEMNMIHAVISEPKTLKDALESKYKTEWQ